MKTADYLNILGRRKKLIFATVFACTLLAGASTYFMQKRYKVSVSLSIPSQYFQIPLLAGFAPEVYDNQELRAQREGLIRRALGHKFLNDIATRYRLINSKDKNSISSFDLDNFSKQFEVIPSGMSNFTINFFGSNAEQGYQILQDFITRLRRLMSLERHTTLLNLHEAIEEQLEKIAYGKQSDAAYMFSDRPEIMERRKERILEEIEILKKTYNYNDNHPRIAELRRQLQKATSVDVLPLEPSKSELLTGGSKVNGTSTLYDDLLKKYRYLEVVIHLDQQNNDQYLNILVEPFVPVQPVWPRLPILLTWGLAGGFFLGSIFALIAELVKARRQNHISVVEYRAPESNIVQIDESEPAVGAFVNKDQEAIFS